MKIDGEPGLVKSLNQPAPLPPRQLYDRGTRVERLRVSKDDACVQPRHPESRIDHRHVVLAMDNRLGSPGYVQGSVRQPRHALAATKATAPGKTRSVPMNRDR